MLEVLGRKSACAGLSAERAELQGHKAWDSGGNRVVEITDLGIPIILRGGTYSIAAKANQYLGLNPSSATYQL